MDRAERARAALEHAYQLIRDVHQIADDGAGSIEARETRMVAYRLARARGFDPDAIVVFAPDGPGVTILMQPSDGAAAVALDVRNTTFLPAWKLFEADARTAIAAVNPPAPTAQQNTARALDRAMRGAGFATPDMRRQLAD